MPFTADQEKVITSRGKNLLVAAAAGSGKTTVLVQRIIELISPDAAKGDAMDARIEVSAVSATRKSQVKVCIRCTAILHSRITVAAFTT